MTHQFLSCDSQSHCGHTHCVFRTRYLPENSSLSAWQSGHEVPVFTCSTGQSIPYTLVCDFREDCIDETDEDFCQHTYCDELKCRNGQCLHAAALCDETLHCLDESDERDCRDIKRTLSPRQEKWQRLLINLDGKGFFTEQVLNSTQSCPNTHYRCESELRHCLPVYTRCNGFYDCPEKEDERDCDIFTCPGFYRCRGSNVCVHADHLCDGWPQCPQRDDEWLCNVTCPAGCLCVGLSFLCLQPFPAHLFPQLRYVDAQGTGMIPLDFTSSHYIVRLNLARCSIRLLPEMKFPNMQVLDLSYNLLSHVALPVFLNACKLKVVLLRGNPLASLSSERSAFKRSALTHLDLSGTSLKILHNQSFLHITDLRHLNISSSKLHTIQRGAFQDTTLLKQLDVRGSPTLRFPLDMFSVLPSLDSVWASDHRLCCKVFQYIYNAKCMAPEPLISFCDRLLGMEEYVIYFWCSGTVATLGNALCFAVYCLTKTAFRDSVVVFMANVHCANFFTGIYLFVISSAHELFRGEFLHHEEMWKEHAACKMAGVLSLMSSQVSIVVLWLLTLDHLIVLYRPSSTYSFNKRSARVACALTWLAALLLASLPLLPTVEQSQLDSYSQSAICNILLPASQEDSKFHYSHIALVFSFVLSAMVTSGQVAAHRKIHVYQVMSTSTDKSPYSSVPLMMSMSLTDAAAWILTAFSSVLVSVRLTGLRVYGAVVVIALPFNSALNPLLCLFHAVKGKWRRQREKRLLRVLKAHVRRLPKRTSLE